MVGRLAIGKRATSSGARPAFSRYNDRRVTETVRCLLRCLYPTMQCSPGGPRSWRRSSASCRARASSPPNRRCGRSKATGSPPIASFPWWWCCRKPPNRSPPCSAIATAKASRSCRAGPGRRSRAARCRSATAFSSAWPSSTASVRSISTIASRWSSPALPISRCRRRSSRPVSITRPIRHRRSPAPSAATSRRIPAACIASNTASPPTTCSAANWC